MTDADRIDRLERRVADLERRLSERTHASGAHSCTIWPEGQHVGGSQFVHVGVASNHWHGSPCGQPGCCTGHCSFR